MSVNCDKMFSHKSVLQWVLSNMSVFSEPFLVRVSNFGLCIQSCLSGFMYSVLFVRVYVFSLVCPGLCIQSCLSGFMYSVLFVPLSDWLSGCLAWRTLNIS